MRQTSLECYQKIKESGALSAMMLKTYEAILKAQPCTSGEALAPITTPTNRLSQSRARFTELRRMGAIKEVGKRKCRESGHTCIVWELTDQMPRKPQKQIKYISIKEAEKILNKNKLIHYIIERPSVWKAQSDPPNKQTSLF